MECVYNKIRDWVHENYHAAYILGTGAITLGAWSLLPKKLRTPSVLYGSYFACLAAGAALDPCVNFNSSAYGKVLTHGNRTEPKIALTFDDGPHIENTPLILDVLASEDVKATFFCVGENALKYPELVLRAKNEGHLIGTHTMSHKNLMACTPAESFRQIKEGIEAVSSVTGEECRYFRPPYGSRYPWTLSQIKQLGQIPVLWCNWPRDWQMPGVETLINRVVGDAKYGDIVLLHDGGGDRRQTAVALKFIIALLKKRGVKFVRVDEL